MEIVDDNDIQQWLQMLNAHDAERGLPQFQTGEVYSATVEKYRAIPSQIYPRDHYLRLYFSVYDRMGRSQRMFWNGTCVNSVRRAITAIHPDALRRQRWFILQKPVRVRVGEVPGRPWKGVSEILPLDRVVDGIPIQTTLVPAYDCSTRRVTKVPRAELPGGMLVNLDDVGDVWVGPSDFYLHLEPARYHYFTKRMREHIQGMRRELLALPLAEREWIAHYIAGLDLGRFCRHSFAGWREVLRCYRQFRVEVGPQQRWILLQFIAQCLEGSRLFALFDFDVIPWLDEPYLNELVSAVNLDRALAESVVTEIRRRIQALVSMHELAERDRVILEYRSAVPVSVRGLREAHSSHEQLVEVDGLIKKAKVAIPPPSLYSDGFVDVEVGADGHYVWSGSRANHRILTHISRLRHDPLCAACDLMSRA